MNRALASLHDGSLEINAYSPFKSHGTPKLFQLIKVRIPGISTNEPSNQNGIKEEEKWKN